MTCHQNGECETHGSKQFHCTQYLLDLRRYTVYVGTQYTLHNIVHSTLHYSALPYSTIQHMYSTQMRVDRCTVALSTYVGQPDPLVTLDKRAVLSEDGGGHVL